MIKCIESGIAGRGLGVSYPPYIKDLATRLDLKGAVLTKSDGSLKIVAEGDEQKLLAFVEEIRKGSFLSTIENFYVNWSEPKHGMGTFYNIN